jgi:hypothetical protein
VVRADARASKGNAEAIGFNDISGMRIRDRDGI